MMNKYACFWVGDVSIRSDGELIEDWQEDIVEPEDLEQAAYEFVQLYRRRWRDARKRRCCYPG